MTSPVTSPAAARSFEERGSALLIVFVFAAIVAITLYMEMPVAVFESQRQKEQLLIDRGNEYAHAVKLFVRKTGSYPGSVEALENTNQMRFLRHRFKDPFTGKDDWRFLHAGPGGVLLDSKVKPLATQQNGNSSGFAFNSNSGSTAKAGGNSQNSQNSMFGTPNSGTFGSDATSDQVVVAPLPQRPPEMRASTGGAPADTTSGSEANQNPMTPLLAPSQVEQLAGNPQTTNPQNGQAQNGQAMAAPPGQPTGAVPGQPMTAAPGQNMPPGISIQQAEQNGPASTAPQPTMGGDAANPNIPMRTLLANPTTPPPQSSPSFGASTMGRTMSGGIAGVASRAEGHSIKTVNDQTDYSLWEFYYDPSKDLTRGLPGTPMPGANPATAPGGTTPGAGNTNANPSGFGQNSTNPNAAPPPAVTPPPPIGAPPNPPLG